MRQATILVVVVLQTLAAIPTAQAEDFHQSANSASHMEDRIAELEVQLAAMRRELDAASVSTTTDAELYPACGSSCSSCCPPIRCQENCCQDCCAGLYFTADYMYWQARRSATPFTGTIVNPTAAAIVNGMPVVVAASYTSQLVETGYDRDNAYRLNLGYLMSDCWDVSARYTYFNTNGTASLGDPTQNLNNVLANRIDKNMANIVLNTTFDDGIVDFATQDIGIDYETYDLEVGRFIYPDIKNLTVRISGGFRYAEIDQYSHTLYVDNTGVSFLRSSTTETVGMSAWGFRAGCEAHYLLGWGTSIFAKTAVSAMYADFDATRYDLQINAANSGFRDVSHSYSSILPVAELTVGGRWEYGGAYLAAGYDVAYWFNMVQGIDPINQDDVDGTANMYRHDRGDLGLAGFFVEVGCLY